VRFVAYPETRSCHRSRGCTCQEDIENAVEEVNATSGRNRPKLGRIRLIANQEGAVMSYFATVSAVGSERRLWEGRVEVFGTSRKRNLLRVPDNKPGVKVGDTIVLNCPTGSIGR